MEQAEKHFNSGKYKEAFNLLSSNYLNIDSYEPNLAICQYLSNRCQQSSINCHRKLNEWLAKKYKRENYKLDYQTEAIVKLNIGILLVLLGKRDNALLVMTDIYKNRGCFIEFMQSRVLLLLMELNINLRHSQRVLWLYKRYPIKPYDSRIQSSQWISLILHEHNRSSQVCKEQFYFLTRIFLNQALIQLCIPLQFLTNDQDDKDIKQQLIQRIKKRKNNINKYYEINVRMISHFHQAQKQFYAQNHVRCLFLMNFANIQHQYEQMPSTKIITNILNALTTSNVGIVHFAQKKFHAALSYFSKAKNLLAKGCTGVEDKDLQLFSTNYANNHEAITYNMALSLLATRSKEAYTFFQAIHKSNPNVQNFKWWYRVGQSIIQQYNETTVNRNLIESTKIITDDQTQQNSSKQEILLLEQAEKCFKNCLNLLDKNQFPNESLLKYVAPNISEEEIQLAHMKFKGEKRDYKRSIITILCYIYNAMGMFAKTVKLATSILEEDMKKEDRLNLLHYLFEAYVQMQNEQYLQATFKSLKKESDTIKDIPLQAKYSLNKEQTLQLNYQRLFIYQTACWYLKNEQPYEAVSLIENIRMDEDINPSWFLKNLLRLLHIQIGLDKNLIKPYVK